MTVCLWDRWWVPLPRGREFLVYFVLKAMFVYPQDFSNGFVAVSDHFCVLASPSLPEGISSVLRAVLGLCIHCVLLLLRAMTEDDCGFQASRCVTNK